METSRFDDLPRRRLHGVTLPVATGFRARLLGLAGLDPEEAGPGLLIPRCASVHTFAMRFDLDVVFLDRRDRPLALHLRVPRRRLLWHRGAAAVLEVPAARGESSPPLAPWGTACCPNARRSPGSSSARTMP